MTDDRRDIARRAAELLENLTEDRLSSIRALVGFDGFIDSIIRIVDRRHSMEPEDFDAIPTILAFADRCAKAAGKSANLEAHILERRFGGNGPLLAASMAALGSRVTYIGAVGCADDHRRLDPIYQPLADLCERVYPIAQAAETDALEFDDGKIMLGKPMSVQQLDWELVTYVVGLDEIREMAQRSSTLGVVNWVMMRGVESIWHGLIHDVLPNLTGPRRRVFIDLCDPAKRTDQDIRRAAELLTEMNRHADVTLGLNRAEAERLAGVLQIAFDTDVPAQSLGSAMAHLASTIRETLGLACCVVHPREGAAGANVDRSAWFEGPFTARPRLSTGAGDHFNGGFAFAQDAGLGLEEALAAGCAVSGAYVRDAQSPSRERLIEFLRDLPESERSG